MSQDIPEIPLPDSLTKPYGPGDEFFVYRKPFIINRGVHLADGDQPEIVPGSKKCAAELSKAEIDDTQVFVGVAGLKSLDLLALIGSDKSSLSSYQNAVLYDVNSRQIQAMGRVLDLIRDNKTPEDFKKAFAKLHVELMEPPSSIEGMGIKTTDATQEEALTAELKQYHSSFGVNKSKYQPQTERGVIKYFSDIDKDPNSWLQPTNYAGIRTMIQNNKIKLVHMDLRDRGRVGELLDWIEEEKLRVGHMYISSTMDFMDPRLQTDYYSKDAGLTKAQDFYTDLLRIGGQQGKFVVSATDPEQEFLEDYYIKVMNRGQMEDQKDSLPNAEPDPHEKRHDFMFNASGQVWRIMSIEGHGGKRYFRVSSEIPVHRAGITKLLTDVIDINEVIADLNASLPKSDMPKVIDSVQIQKEDLLPELTSTRDYKHYAEQEKRANDIVQSGEAIDPDKTFSIQLSSDPFMMDSKPGESPATTLKHLQHAIEAKLERDVDKETPVVEVKPDAAARFLESRGRKPGVPPASHVDRAKNAPGSSETGRGA